RNGEQVTFAPGALNLSLDRVDELCGVLRSDGYKTVTNTLWTWFTISPPASDDAAKLIVSAGRRLDVAHAMFEKIRATLVEARTKPGGIAARDLYYDLIGSVEVATVALNRALQMTLLACESNNVTVNRKLAALAS